MAISNQISFLFNYRYVDMITFVKLNKKKRLRKGIGFYLRHCKETCLVGLKGEIPIEANL